ncbi:MAG: glucose-6-phosphate isomerase family protein [Bacillota bacterium]
MTVDLTSIAGLPLTFDLDTKELRWAPDVRMDRAVQRRLGEILSVLRQPDADEPDRLLYYMTYDLRQQGEEQSLRSLNLRYDVTVLLPGRVGTEPIKTAGHYHPAEASSGLAYPEIYTVLAGHAHYLLQRDGSAPGEVTEAVLVQAEAGDKLLIPPGYGHISINPGPGPLIMANLVAADFAPNYGPIRALGGGCYLAEQAEEAGLPLYRPNPRYGAVPPLRRARAADLPAYGLERGVPLYTAFSRNPGRFQYVARPGAEGGPAWRSLSFWS